MGMIVKLLFTSLAAYFAAKLLPGVEMDNFWTAIIVAIVLGLLNTFVRPIIAFLSLPFTVLSLGLFIFIINTIIILLCSWLVPSFKVDGFFAALLFSIVFSIISWILGIIFN